jgi:hypothetical protein
LVLIAQFYVKILKFPPQKQAVKFNEMVSCNSVLGLCVCAFVMFRVQISVKPIRILFWYRNSNFFKNESARACMVNPELIRCNLVELCSIPDGEGIPNFMLYEPCILE